MIEFSLFSMFGFKIRKIICRILEKWRIFVYIDHFVDCFRELTNSIYWASASAFGFPFRLFHEFHFALPLKSREKVPGA